MPARAVTHGLQWRRPGKGMTVRGRPRPLMGIFRRARLLAGALLFPLSALLFWPVPAQAAGEGPVDAAIRQQLATGGGFFRSGSTDLLLAPDGHFLYGGASGPGGSAPWLGTWSLDAGSGDLCLMPLPPQVVLLATGKPGKRAQAVHYSAALARAGLVSAGPAFDGPSQLKALAAEAGRNGREAGVLTLDRGTPFIHVAIPVRRENRQVIYTSYRFPVARDAAVYRIILSGVSAHDGPPHPLAGCGPLSAFGLTDARALQATERTALEAQLKQALVAPATEPADAQDQPRGKQQAWRHILPQDTSRFSMPQTSVKLTVGRRQPDLYQAATDALADGGPAFSQDRRAAQASRPDARVLGAAAGLKSSTDFDVDMRLLGEGRLDIAVLSRQHPMEINEEGVRARELFDRVLNAFPMLAPVGPRSTPPSRTQGTKS